MSGSRQYSKDTSMEMFLSMLTQWQNNAATLRGRSRNNLKVQEMCQSLHEAVSAVEGWATLNGSVQLTVHYQPGMLNDEDFEGGANWIPY